MKELHVPKPKLRLSAALTFAALLACLALAPVALAAPHVNLLDAEGDASEHRAITIGTEKSYHGELKGTDDSARSWSWNAATCAASYRVQVKSGKSWKTAAAPVKNASGGTLSSGVSELYSKGSSGKTEKLTKSSALEFRVVPVNSDGEVIGKETSKDYQGSVGAYRWR